MVEADMATPTHTSHTGPLITPIIKIAVARIKQIGMAIHGKVKTRHPNNCFVNDEDDGDCGIVEITVVVDRVIPFVGSVDTYSRGIVMRVGDDATSAMFGIKDSAAVSGIIISDVNSSLGPSIW